MELKLHSMYQSMYSSSVFHHLFKYEKQTQSEKEIYILNEAVDETQYMSLDQFAKQHGGLLRIPLYVKTNQSISIAKLWLSQIINLIRQLQDLGNPN